MSWTIFFEMGGYAVYIWPAFSLSAIVLFVMLFISINFLKSQTKKLKEIDALIGKNQTRQ